MLVKGDMVRVKNKWLEKNENPNKIYFVMEDEDDFGRVRVKCESDNIFGFATFDWLSRTLYKIGHIDVDEL